MPVSGIINTEFMKFILYGEVMVLSPKFKLYRQNPLTGETSLIKELPATCNPIDVSGGIGISCKASDTSTDEYTASYIRVVRSVTGLPSGAPELVLVYDREVSKSSGQRLDIEFRAQLTT